MSVFEWRPFKTAPRDGTPILVSRPQGLIYRVLRYDADNQWWSDRYWVWVDVDTPTTVWADLPARPSASSPGPWRPIETTPPVVETDLLFYDRQGYYDVGWWHGQQDVTHWLPIEPPPYEEVAP